MADALIPDRRGNVADFRLSIGDIDLAGGIFAELRDLVDITAEVRPRLVGLTLSEKRGGEADQLDLVLDDTDGRLDLPRKGQVVRLQLGWLRGADVVPGLVDKGAFTVDEVEWSSAPAQVRLTARSADLTAAFRTRREKAHRGTTLGAIAREIAGRHGYEARVAPELDPIAVPVLAQAGQSDMALLRRLGREHDAVATVKDRRLILSPIGRAATTSGRALPALTLAPTDGSNVRYREIERGADAPVEARWMNSAMARRETVTVGDGKAAPRRLGRVYHSEAEARRAAQAAAARARRGAAEFDMTLALGRPDLYPERPVTLAGFKSAMDANAWLIAELTHTIDASGGFVTGVRLEMR